MLLYCDRVKCETTCDSKGADEIYFVVFGKKSTGEALSFHNASPTKIDEPDEDDPSELPPRMILPAEMTPGQSAWLMVTLMSHDGTNIADLAKEVTDAVLPGVAIVAPDWGAALRAFSEALGKVSGLVADRDDIIGMFYVIIECVAPDNYKVQWHPVEQCASAPAPGGWYFRMTGDGGVYHTWFSVK